MPSEVSTGDAYQDLGRIVEELRRELAEAHRREAATNEILHAISNSPTDVDGVLGSIAESAARLLDVPDAEIMRVDGEVLKLVAKHGPSQLWAVESERPINRDWVTGRAVVDRTTVQVADLQTEARDFPLGAAYAKQYGHRTTLATPLLRKGVPVGAILIRRLEVRVLTEKQIALLRVFADQAVIAMENLRLFEEVQARTRELAQSLDYQTTISDVLGVISRSQFDLQSVLQSVVETAARLCRADNAILYRLEDGACRFAAGHGHDSKMIAALRTTAHPIGPGTAAGRAVAARRAVQIEDVLADPLYAVRDLATLGNVRSLIGVPLMRGGEPIGAIALARSRIEPFNDREIDVVTTFADQAVIAINNVGLFDEVQARTRDVTEALEYQTATSDVLNNILNVISRSPTDVQPVFDMIAQSSARLCAAQFCFVYRFDGQLLHFVAHHGESAEGVELLRRAFPAPPSRGTAAARAVLDCSVVSIPDITADPDFTLGGAAMVAGYRGVVAVPMLRDGIPIGSIAVARSQVGFFPDRQIELLKTFADQAVIAIENTRLFEEVQARTRELTEALQQQTATSDLLQVISSSPGELEPVFQVMLENAVRFCGAKFGTLFLCEADAFRAVATHNAPPAYVEALTRDPLQRPPPDVPLGRAAITKQVVVETDIKTTQSYIDRHPFVVDAVELGGYRSVLAVPMLKDNVLIGSINILGQEVRPFTEKQIDLVKHFASQAVIAIENTRLLNELRESLQQQTATADVLQVISSSPTDVRPVFDTIAESAVRLCSANYGSVNLLTGDMIDLVAQHGHTASWLNTARQLFPHPLGRDLIAGVSMLDRQIVHVEDMQTDPRFPTSQSLARTMGYRTALSVPMLRDTEPVGAIVVFRQERRSFTEAEIGLLRTFAAQAVIAIENTRLFDEVQERNRDLTALGEVGRAVSSTLDLKVVLKTVVRRAVELSGTDGGAIFYYRQASGRFELGETVGLDDGVVERFRKLDISTGETGLGEAIAKCQPLQVPDILKRASNPLRDAALEAGLRAALIVPLLGGEGPLGALVLQRRRPGEFPQAVVSLMQSFADQSAIALENARLFEEIAQKGRELEIASQHKSQFVANMSHELRTPLAAILGYAELMQEGFYGAPSAKSMDALTRIRSNGKHLLGLINTVLDIAKIESGQFSLNLSEYALENMVETVRVATESLAETKKLSLNTDVAKRLPNGFGDEQRLTQVLLNLVGNAIKFTDAGEVRITATTADSHFTVAVTDTGPGIPADQLHKVFEQFHQVDNSSTRAKGGTGLGLAIAKQIVEMHGGRIWVESTAGKGAVFQMQLPIRAQSIKGAA